MMPITMLYDSSFLYIIKPKFISHQLLLTPHSLRRATAHSSSHTHVRQNHHFTVSFLMFSSPARYHRIFRPPKYCNYSDISSHCCKINKNQPLTHVLTDQLVQVSRLEFVGVASESHQVANLTRWGRKTWRKSREYSTYNKCKGGEVKVDTQVGSKVANHTE